MKQSEKESTRPGLQEERMEKNDAAEKRHREDRKCIGLARRTAKREKNGAEQNRRGKALKESE